MIEIWPEHERMTSMERCCEIVAVWLAASLDNKD
jgi:hypothetical protein